MSELAKAITANVTTYRQAVSPLFREMFRADVEHSRPQLETGRVYSIKATFGANVLITDQELASNDESVSMAVERTKRQVIEAVFGEFRPNFRMIEKAIYERDIEKASKLLYEMEMKMFDTTGAV